VTNPDLIAALTDACVPADTSGVALLGRLLNRELTTPADVLAAQPDLEFALGTLNTLSQISKHRVDECLNLSPQPSNRVPLGF